MLTYHNEFDVTVGDVTYLVAFDVDVEWTREEDGVCRAAMWQVTAVERYDDDGMTMCAWGALPDEAHATIARQLEQYADDWRNDPTSPDDDGDLAFEEWSGR